MGGARDVAALPGLEASAFSHIARGAHAPTPPRKTAARPTATNWVVSNCNDAGAGSLRDIVDHFAVDGDTVDMTALTCGSITLTTGSIFTAANNLTFEGPASSTFFIGGGDALRLFGHLGSGTLTFRHLVLSHGYARSTGINDAAGGCIASYGTVSLDHVVAKYCKAGAADNGVGVGGAVFAANVEIR
ncbi:MAG TPA: hypothetical protein VKB52_04345, partial [Rhodanobacteraceae bacterium]|nr:hypothetical protein [Rhodanobacteraceae bacterium]